jgi:excisionase family DNA binding protein
MLSLREAADILGISAATVRRLIGKQQLPAARIGGQARIDAGDLRRFVAASRLGRSACVSYRDEKRGS